MSSIVPTFIRLSSYLHIGQSCIAYIFSLSLREQYAIPVSPNAYIGAFIYYEIW